VPRNLKRYYGFGHLHFITFSCYQRFPLLGSHRRRDLFLRALEATRLKYGMLVMGYVVMPEHVHLLVSEPGRRDLSVAIKALKQGVARRVLRRLRGAGCQRPLFADGAPERFWQARFYDFNVWSAKKRTEKLRYIHRNPVKRGLVAGPELWRWSSFRHYAYGEAGPVAITSVFPAHWPAQQTRAA
jgi:putative transposase